MTKDDNVDKDASSTFYPSSIIVAAGTATTTSGTSDSTIGHNNPGHHLNDHNTGGSSATNDDVVVKNISHRTEITSRSTESFNNMMNDDRNTMPQQASPPPPLSAFDDTTLNITSGSDSMMMMMTTIHNIDPPISVTERYRDFLLRTFDLPIFQYIGLVVIFGVIADGAIFFFLLMGWHTLCHPVTDCEPRNTVYNISIQILNGFFTYMALLSLPWRLSNFLHLSKTIRYCLCCCGCVRDGCYPQRKNSVGHNLYGLSDPDIWFHIPVRRRYYISTLLLCNCFFQFINHGTRIVHSTYEEQDSYPGNVWTNVFFVSAFSCAGVGATWILYETSQLRKQHPTKFGHGPMDAMQHFYHHHFLRWVRHHLLKSDRQQHPTKTMKKNETNIVDENSDVADGMDEKMEEETNFDEVEVAFHHRERIAATREGSMNGPEQNHHVTVSDPTRAANHPAILLEDRGAMRMFGF